MSTSLPWPAPPDGSASVNDASTIKFKLTNPLSTIPFAEIFPGRLLLVLDYQKAKEDDLDEAIPHPEAVRVYENDEDHRSRQRTRHCRSPGSRT